jgi:hypothetical protein
MIKMIASKKLKYPHGSSGKEYKAGDKFEALSERDAKTLNIIGKAAYDTKGKRKTVDLPTKAMEPQPPVEEPKVEEVKAEEPVEVPTYNRRDMRAEGE